MSVGFPLTGETFTALAVGATPAAVRSTVAGRDQASRLRPLREDGGPCFLGSGKRTPAREPVARPKAAMPQSTL
jgi:hypothetical protein